MSDLFSAANQLAGQAFQGLRRFAAIAFAIGSLTICPAMAQAGTATGTLTVTLTVTASCTITAAATLSFGSVAGTTLQTTAQTASTPISVTCTNGSPFAIGMGPGLYNSSGNRMANGGNYIPYALYQDSGLTKPWTTAASSTTCTTTSDCVLATGTGSAQPYTIYGQVPTVASAPPPGAYSDTVTMTIMY